MSLNVLTYPLSWFFYTKSKAKNLSEKDRSQRKQHGVCFFLLTLLATVFFLPGISGCSTLQLEKIREKRPSSFPDHEEAEGIIYFCRPVLDEKTCSLYFYRHLPSYGILPVVFYIENQSPNSIIFDPSKVRLICEDSTVLRPTEWEEVYYKTRLSSFRAVPGFLLGIIPGIFVLHSVSKSNKALRHALVSQAIGPTYVKSGEYSQGILFLKPDSSTPLEDINLNGADLQISCLIKEEGQTRETSLCFHFWEKELP